MGEFVQVEDVRQAIGPGVADAPDEFVSSLIYRAETRLAAQVPRLHERLLVGQLDPAFVSAVLLDAILPVIRNPGGYTGQTVGDVSRTYSAASVSTRIVFNEDDLRLLRPRLSAVRSVSVAVPDWRMP